MKAPQFGANDLGERLWIVDGFADVAVEQLVVDGVPGRFQAGVAGEEHARRVGMIGLDFFDQLHSGGLWHYLVGDEDRKLGGLVRKLCEQLAELVGPAGQFQFAAVAKGVPVYATLDKPPDGREEVAVVVDTGDQVRGVGLILHMALDV